jgi:hypothetical protein
MGSEVVQNNLYSPHLDIDSGSFDELLYLNFTSKLALRKFWEWIFLDIFACIVLQICEAGQ